MVAGSLLEVLWVLHSVHCRSSGTAGAQHQQHSTAGANTSCTAKKPTHSCCSSLTASQTKCHYPASGTGRGWWYRKPSRGSALYGFEKNAWSVILPCATGENKLWEHPVCAPENKIGQNSTAAMQTAHPCTRVAMAWQHGRCHPCCHRRALAPDACTGYAFAWGFSQRPVLLVVVQGSRAGHAAWHSSLAVKNGRSFKNPAPVRLALHPCVLAQLQYTISIEAVTATLRHPS